MAIVRKVLKLLRTEQLNKGQCPERNIIQYLRMWNKNLSMDDYGNLYLINPGTPLICAHMDTVQKDDDVAKLSTIHQRGDEIKWDNIIIGADDKAGIAMAMELYELFWNKVSLLFTRQEETGCNGSRDFCTNHSDLIKQCTYCLVLDRKNAWDIIGYQNGFCWKEFDEALEKQMKTWWYKSVSWGISDTGNIWKLINAVNLSIGYYGLHTKQECLKVSEYETALRAIADVIENFAWADYPLYVAPPVEKKDYKCTSRQKYNWSLFNDRLCVYDYFESAGKDEIRLKKDICLYNNNKTFIISKWIYTVEEIEMSSDFLWYDY